MPQKKGCIPWNKGLTKETDKRVAKYAATKTGVPMSEEQKQHLKDLNTGKILSEKTCKAIGEGHRGMKYKMSLKPDDHKVGCYNITVGEVNAMNKKQKGLCAICGKPESRKNPLHKNKICTLSIDHDHKTEQFRGLLCIKCNFGLGHFDDDPELLLKAIKYLLSK